MYAITKSTASGLARRNGTFAPALRRGFRGRGTSTKVMPRWRCGTGTGTVEGSLGYKIWLRRQSTSTTSQPPPSQSTSNANSNANPSTTPKKKPLTLRLPAAIALTLLSFTLGFATMALPSIPPLLQTARPPTDQETMSLYKPSTDHLAAIESQILSHPYTRSLLQNEKYTASRPHLKIPEAMRHQSLTGGTLLGDDKIAVPPLQFQTQDGAHFVSLQYLGHALCGHPGIVHGGLLATLLDEGLGRCCFPALPNKVAVTASLKVDYKKPVMAGQIVVLKAETTRVEGRKAWVRGWMETLPEEGKEGEGGTVLVEAEALFIEPRQAGTMKRVAT
ncbi:Thioesterase/thiol ester dehydrase-isomerase [Byssothecium circinans]|uniref:Thioesterase/thiol ester dehydrase-isomerase n=1 Tax=Byssothecium circinans TaxID=147558 RepID=A0A6A5TL06_9PLEO|nr:Thioesterase/thiol ester dehydrase-isomerase [Byssothecium circinans]